MKEENNQDVNEAGHEVLGCSLSGQKDVAQPVLKEHVDSSTENVNEDEHTFVTHGQSATV
jgi:hypothetical protein